jgi:hypothetical protein
MERIKIKNAISSAKSKIKKEFYQKVIELYG